MKKKLKYYGGSGYMYSSEEGKYEVKAETTIKFSKLSAAVRHYYSLDEEKALWDLTKIPELLCCHTY